MATSPQSPDEFETKETSSPQQQSSTQSDGIPSASSLDPNNKQQLLQDLIKLREQTAQSDVSLTLLDDLCNEHVSKLVEILNQFNTIPSERRTTEDLDVLLNIGWTLTNIAGGEERHTLQLISDNAIDAMMDAVGNNRDENVCTQMLWGISNVAGDCDMQTLRKIVSDDRVTRAAAKLTRKNLEPPMYGEKLNRLEQDIWLIGNFCRFARITFADDENDLGLRDLLNCTVKVIQQVQDADVRSNAVYALTNLFDCSTPTGLEFVSSAADDELYIEKILSLGACDVLHLLVGFCDPAHLVQRCLRTASLQALGNLVGENSSAPQLLISYGLAEHLFHLLKNTSKYIRKLSAWILSNLVVGADEITDYLFALDIFPTVIEVCQSDEESMQRKEVGWILIAAVTNANYNRVESLVESGLFGALVPLFAQTHTDKAYGKALLDALYHVLHVGSCLALENAFSEKAELALLYEVLEEVQADCTEEIYNQIEKLLKKYRYVSEQEFLQCSVNSMEPSVAQDGDYFRFGSDCASSGTASSGMMSTAFSF